MSRVSNFHKLRRVISPSWLSGFLSVAGALLTMITTFVIAHSNSVVANELFALHTATRGVSSNYQSIALNLDSNRIISNLPLFIFWGSVGLIIYYFVTQIFKSFGSVLELSHEIEYVHSNRRAIIKEAIIHAILRAIDLVSWMLFLVFTVHNIVPYCISFARVAALNVTAETIFHVVLATILLILTLGVQVVFLRILFLRTRIMSNIVEE